jgi:hypothetical protein
VVTAARPAAQLLTRDLGNGRSELITLSWWADLDQIRAFVVSLVRAPMTNASPETYFLTR